MALDPFIMKIILVSVCFLLVFNSSLANSTEVVLSNGDILNGKVLSTEDGVVTLKHPTLGIIKLTNSAVKPVAVEKSQAIDGGLLNSGFIQAWQRSAEIGVNGSEGNSRNMHIHAGATLTFENEYKRWNIGAAYNSKQDTGETTSNDFFIRFTRDFLTPSSSRFYFTEGRYDWDEFGDWDYRISFGGGWGEPLIKEKNWSLLGRMGVGFSKEFSGKGEQWVPEGILGIDSSWAIADRNVLIFKNTLYPSLKEFGGFRNVSELSWVIGLDQLNGIDLKIGLLNEFDSNASGVSRKNDFKYNLSLVFGI